jgi:L-lactate dehydrogenase complex protein LldG
MGDNGRTAFLDRVAAAVRSGNKHREPTRRELPERVGYVGAGSNPITTLIEELTKVGTHARIAETREQLKGAVVEIVERHSVRRALLNDAAIIRQLDIAGTLRDAGVEVSTIEQLAGLNEPARNDRLFAAELGVAAPDWAVAETGSLVYAAAAAQTRAASLLPPVHVAIVDIACVLPDLLDLPERLENASPAGVLSRNIALVTGPSKTGDIELKLTTGVHGPGDVHVLIWNPTDGRADR